MCWIGVRHCNGFWSHCMRSLQWSHIHHLITILRAFKLITISSSIILFCLFLSWPIYIPQIITAEVWSAVPRINWTNHETDALMDYLHKHCSEGNLGGKFKDTTYNAAAMHIQLFYISEKPKVGKSIKTKWNTISLLYWNLKIISWLYIVGLYHLHNNLYLGQEVRSTYIEIITKMQILKDLPLSLFSIVLSIRK